MKLTKWNNKLLLRQKKKSYGLAKDLNYGRHRTRPNDA